MSDQLNQICAQIDRANELKSTIFALSLPKMIIAKNAEVAYQFTDEENKTIALADELLMHWHCELHKYNLAERKRREQEALLSITLNNTSIA